MERPKIPSYEEDRLKELWQYHILDTLPEQEYDEITLLASRIANTPIALVTFVGEEKQCFKSHWGLDIAETAKDYSFCAHAINPKQETMVIPDSREDPRFYDNPLVTGSPYVIFYAGVPLVTPEGNPLGTLCVIDHQPGNLSDQQLESLTILANQVVRVLELRRNKMLLSSTNQALEAKNDQLEKFAHRAAHDIKSPLNNISGIVDYLIQTQKNKLDEEGEEMLELINSSSLELMQLVEGILKYSRSEKWLWEEKEKVDLNQIFEEIKGHYITQNEFCHFQFPQVDHPVHLNKVVLKQILFNLISNSVKYCDKEQAQIKLDFSEDEQYYHFTLTDNGPGIPRDKCDSIFELFESLNGKKNKGTGIGLATVKKLVEGMEGAITVESSEGAGSIFRFSLSK